MTRHRTTKSHESLDPSSDAATELRQAEAEMVAVYQHILQRCSSGPEANRELAANLRKAQRAWITFYNAHIAAIYSERGNHGSVAALRRAQIRAELVRARTAQLREWWE